MTFIYNGDAGPLIAMSLIDLGYELLDFDKSLDIFISEETYCIYINVDKKQYKFYQNHEISGPHIDHTLATLAALGISRSIEEQENYLIEKYNSIRLPLISKLFNTNKSTEAPKKLDNILHPGRIIRFKKGDEIYLGVLLTETTCVYFNNEAKIKGYGTNLNLNYDGLLGVYQPTTEHYRIQDYQNMIVIWERKCTIKKSIAEIEKELGLDPGMLEITNG